MENNTKFTKKEIDHFLYNLSSFMGLKISGYFLSGMLFISQIYFVINSYKNFSTLYILVSNLLLPLILEESFKKEKSSLSLPFPMLSEKYRFSYAIKKARTYGFIVNLIFLFAWCISYTEKEVAFLPAAYVSLGILVFYIIIRIVVWLGFLVVFKICPTKMMG